MNQTLPAPLDVKLMNLTASVLFVGCAMAVLAAGAWWVLRYPGFAVSRIVVHGDLVHNNAVTLRANVAPHLAGNFFTVDLRAARAAFEQVPWVRRAEVQRVYPGSLLVQLQEHDAVAWWGEEGSGELVNSHGEVFEASPDDVDQLPELKGPAERAAEVLAMHQALQARFARLELGLERLELGERGAWRARLHSGAVIELGRGTPEELQARVQRFVGTLPQITERYAGALQTVDLRYPNGYALRVRGVTTTNDQATPNTPSNR